MIQMTRLKTTAPPLTGHILSVSFEATKKKPGGDGHVCGLQPHSGPQGHHLQCVFQLPQVPEGICSSN